MFLFTKLQIGRITAHDMDSWRQLLLASNPIIPFWNVLQKVILLFVFEIVEFISYMLLLSWIICNKVRMNVLHAHPWVCAIGINTQRIHFIHSYWVDCSVVFDLNLRLPSFNSSTCKYVAVIHLHEVIPSILESSIVHSILKLTN